ncbi:MAG: AIM24 family protein [Acidobacteriota bacterium]|nr:AIM24 family protein [Acidobacteriota bacterium]
MSDATVTSYTCPYCRSTSSGAETTCPSCGAPVDIARRTTSGWVEQPAIPDMTRIQMGGSTMQILGKLAPAADVRLAAGEGVMFPQHSLLWQEPSVQVDNLRLDGAWNRMRAGLPVVMLEAKGPGTISFSADRPGELVAIPVQAGSAVDVREHHMIAATSGLGFEWYDSGIWFVTRGSPGAGSQFGGSGLLKLGMDAVLDSDRDDRNETEYHYPLGQFVDRFVARDRPGLVLAQAGGNVFLRDLADGESILVKPPALLYKDPGVAWQLHVEFPHAGMKFWRSWGNRYMWLRLWGPGRVALQSSYDRLEDPGTDFRDSCQYTQHMW